MSNMQEDIHEELKMEFVTRCKTCGKKIICKNMYSRNKTKYCPEHRKERTRASVRKSYWKNRDYYLDKLRKKRAEKKK